MFKVKKRIKKLEEEITFLNENVADLRKTITEQQEKLNPPVFGGRKQV